MKGPLTNKRIVLGVTGSIACYKALELASKLVQNGALVDTIMTKSSQEFLTPLAFKSITHRDVVTNMYDINSEFAINHVGLAESADIIVIAPATANTISKISNGMSDDSLTTTVLASKCPILIAPAMDGNMFDNPATQNNIATLISRGVFISGPEYGRLASGLIGNGRMTSPKNLVDIITMTLGSKGDLSGKKILISAGGTTEPIDPVRFITNKSSGKMGYSIAAAAGPPSRRAASVRRAARAPSARAATSPVASPHGLCAGANGRWAQVQARPARADPSGWAHRTPGTAPARGGGHPRRSTKRRRVRGRGYEVWRAARAVQYPRGLRS